MKLTKEECEKGLQFLKEHAMELVDDEDMEGNMVYDYYNISEEDLREYVEPLEKLIEEHFKDKKTLKERFKGHEGEKIKDDPWGDRYADECSKEEIDKWIYEGYGLPPIREE